MAQGIGSTMQYNKYHHRAHHWRPAAQRRHSSLTILSASHNSRTDVNKWALRVKHTGI